MVENILDASKEYQQIYAEIQICRSNDSPLIERSELPEPEPIYPDQVELNDENPEYEDILRENIALASTLRYWLQNSSNIATQRK